MTASPRPPLPDFSRPPVVEVTLSAQYEPLTKLRGPHLGLFWAAIRDRFPFAQEHPPLPQIIENLAGAPEQESGMRVELLKIPPLSRCWFINEAGSELVQVQQDRFIANWRQTNPAEAYPRYEHVRDVFVRHFETYSEFLHREQLGTIVPNQCEVTYVNHIRAGDVFNSPGELGRVFTVWNSRYSDEFLSDPEDVRFAIRYLIHGENNDLLGRLHVAIEPRYASDGSLIFVMSLTARGRPKTRDFAGILNFFDLGRKWIVRGFTSVTSKEMHRVWGRHDKQ